MNAVNDRHETSTALVKTAPAELDAGRDVALKVKVECLSKCNLQHGQVQLTNQQGQVLKQVELATFENGAAETDELTVTAPIKPGTYTWIVVFPEQELQGLTHAVSSAPVSFTVKPHATSMAVWDVPMPIIRNSPFKIKVGVQCAAKCSVAGQTVEVYDDAGTLKGTGTLGAELWPGTSALYWAEVAVGAPDTEGQFKWTARFTNPELEMAHAPSSYPLTFGTVRPPDHVVTVEVVDKEKQTPVPNAQVILHPFRARSDEQGIARVGVTKGEYHLFIPQVDGHALWSKDVKVESDMSLKAELEMAEEIEP